MTPMDDILAPQPPPDGDGPSVTDHALTACRDPRVRELLRQRRQQGAASYGTELRAWNGRNAQADAAQELVDAILYLRQAEIEGDEGASTDARVVETVLARLLRRRGVRHDR